jgi:hypothetical protein
MHGNRQIWARRCQELRRGASWHDSLPPSGTSKQSTAYLSATCLCTPVPWHNWTNRALRVFRPCVRVLLGINFRSRMPFRSRSRSRYIYFCPCASIPMRLPQACIIVIFGHAFYAWWFISRSRGRSIYAFYAWWFISRVPARVISWPGTYVRPRSQLPPGAAFYVLCVLRVGIYCNRRWTVPRRETACVFFSNLAKLAGEHIHIYRCTYEYTCHSIHVRMSIHVYMYV